MAVSQGESEPNLVAEEVPGLSQQAPGSGWVETALLALLFAAAFLVRLWPVWQVHFWDEAVYLQNAEVIRGAKDNYSELSSRPPLLSLLFAGVFLLWRHDFAASLLVAALNALGPVLLYGVGAMLYGKGAAAISALLLAFSPFFAQWGNSLLTDCPALTLMLSALWVWLKALSTRRKGLYFLAGLLCGLAGLMRFTSLVVVGVFPLYLLRRGERVRQLLWAAGLFGLGLAAGFGPYLLWSRAGYGSLFATLRLARQNVGGSVEPPWYYVENFGQVFPWITLAGAVLWFVAWWLDRRAGRGLPLIWEASLWWWALVVLAYFSDIPHKELRYIIPLAAPWFLLAGRGLSLLLRGQGRYARLVAAGLLLPVMAYSFAPTLERFRSPFIEPFISEEKRAADYLNEIARPPAALYTNFNAPVFAYYTRLPIRAILEEDVSFYQVFPNNMPEDGYLVLYKELQKHPMPVWADVNPHFRRLQEFPSLVVYEYRRSEPQ